MAVVTITATGAGTWTAPVGVVAIVVECWGGGGAGGQRSSNNSGAGGGGGGSYARVNALPVTGSTVYNYTVGIGGTDGATPVSGGTTTFTGDAGAFCAAPGATSVTANSQTATAGATAVNGDNVRGGGAGANGTATISGGGGESGSPDFAGFSAAGVTGGTGRTDGGDGGNGRTTTSADGFAGIQPGGGGGGGYRTTGTTRNGGAGGAGQLRITYTAYVFAATGTAYALTGTDLHFRHSVPFDPAVYTLTGTAATLTGGSAGTPIMPASPSSYAVTGAAVVFTHAVPTLSAPYNVTGATVAFVLGHGIVLVGDTYVLTGTAVPTLVGAKVVATTTAYALTGVDANLVPQVGTAKTIAASPVAYTYLGTATPLTHAIPILAEPFTEYVVSGTDVFFNYSTTASGATINGLPGSYIYNTGIASLAFTRPGDPGTYALTGTDTTLRKGFSLVGGPVAGVYTYTGQTQLLLRSFPIAATAGTYVLTGSDVSFIFNGVTTIIIPVAGETYTTTGSDLFMYAFRYLSTDEGFYPLTGADAALSTFQSEVFFITLDLGVYDLNGTAAGLVYTPSNAFGLAGGAGSGAYVLTGSDATPRRTGLAMPAVGGSYAVTGAAVTFPATPRKIVVDSGTYVINGAIFSLRRRPKPGGGFDYIFGSGAGRDSIIPQRRRRRH